jgi:hypothetical protein
VRRDVEGAKARDLRRGPKEPSFEQQIYFPHKFPEWSRALNEAARGDAEWLIIKLLTNANVPDDVKSAIYAWLKNTKFSTNRRIMKSLTPARAAFGLALDYYRELRRRGESKNSALTQAAEEHDLKTETFQKFVEKGLKYLTPKEWDAGRVTPRSLKPHRRKRLINTPTE